MNTLSLVLLASGVLVVVVGLVIVVAGRTDRPDGPDEGGRPVGGAAIAGLVIVALGVVIAVAGGVLLALPRDGAVEAAGGSAESTTAAPTTSVFGESGDGDDELASGPGTECGLVETAAGQAAMVRIEQGRIACAEAVGIVQSYFDRQGGGADSTVTELDGWRCSTAAASVAAQRGYGTSCLRNDVQVVVPNTGDTGSHAPTPDRPAGTSRPDGDLGLSTPMTRPACDGRGIVVLYSAVTPGAYESEIRSALAANPGARYLRTDQACPSLRQRDEHGNVIYAVYRESGYSKAELCADVARAPAGAYGRWLDTTSDPTTLVTC